MEVPLALSRVAATTVRATHGHIWITRMRCQSRSSCAPPRAGTTRTAWPPGGTSAGQSAPAPWRRPSWTRGPGRRRRGSGRGRDRRRLKGPRKTIFVAIISTISATSLPTWSLWECVRMRTSTGFFSVTWAKASSAPSMADPHSRLSSRTQESLPVLKDGDICCTDVPKDGSWESGRHLQ